MLILYTETNQKKKIHIGIGIIIATPRIKMYSVKNTLQHEQEQSERKKKN